GQSAIRTKRWWPFGTSWFRLLRYREKLHRRRRAFRKDNRLSSGFVLPHEFGVQPGGSGDAFPCEYLVCAWRNRAKCKFAVGVGLHVEVFPAVFTPSRIRDKNHCRACCGFLPKISNDAFKSASG